MVFDDRTGRGESIKGDIDTVHTPLVVDALTEYLYGPANGKIVRNNKGKKIKLKHSYQNKRIII